MTQNSYKINDLVAGAQVDAGDSDADTIAKLNEIALKIAEAQGKTPVKSGSSNLNVTSDPMDELGCEGCQ